jgi:hypothetical protein
VIESLEVSLPGTEKLSVAFREMSGNVFDYDFGGELYSGMMYQVDTNSYVVTLTNGPLEGTRLKFDGAPSVEQIQANEQALAENEQKDERVLGNDGSDTAKPEVVDQVALAPAQNVQEAYDRDLQIQQDAAQLNEQQQFNGETLQAQEVNPEQAPGFYEQAQSTGVGGEIVQG